MKMNMIRGSIQRLFAGLMLICFIAAMFQPDLASGKTFPNEDYRAWNYDLNQNRIDDRIDAGGLKLRDDDFIILFNECVTDDDVDFVLDLGMYIKFRGRYVQAIVVGSITWDQMNALTAYELDGKERVFRVELVETGQFCLFESTCAVQARENGGGYAWRYATGLRQENWEVGDCGYIIAIFDSGVDRDELINWWGPAGRYNAITNDEDPFDDDLGHGTALANIACFYDDFDDYSGVAYDADYIDVKVGDASNPPNSLTHLRAIDWAIRHRNGWDIPWDLHFCDHLTDIHVILIGYTLGEHANCNGKCASCMAVDKAVDAGITVVAPVGNVPLGPIDTEGIKCPAAADRSIAVGAIDYNNSCNRNDDQVWPLSYQGLRRDDNMPELDYFDTDPIDEQKPDVYAPGFNIDVSSELGIPDNKISGTSAAAAHVAGVVALMYDYSPRFKTPDDMKNLIRVGAYDFMDGGGDWVPGEVDAYQVLCRGSEPTDLRIESWDRSEIYTNIVPTQGVECILGATVWNDSDNDAENVHVVFYTNRNTIGYDGWTRIGEDVISFIPGRGSAPAEIEWIPIAGHQCIRARAINCRDADRSNNQGQRNFNPKRASNSDKSHRGRAYSHFVVEAGTPYTGPQNFRMHIDAWGLHAEDGWEAVITSEDGLFEEIIINTSGEFDVEFVIEDDCCPRLINVDILAPDDGPPDPTDNSEIILQGWVGDVMVGQQTLHSYIEFLEGNWTITIDKAHNALQGHDLTLSVTTEFRQHEMGGFDFLIAYDALALTAVSVAPGQLLQDCRWEYFTYRFGANGNCGEACPSGLLRIIAIAETNDGSNHPSCYKPPDDDKHELAAITFFVTNDRTFSCQYIPVYFFWGDCGDNSISSKDGDLLYVSSQIFDFEGHLLWDEFKEDEYPEDERIPFVGAPDYCLNPDPDKPSARRFLTFVNGGVDIICSDSIDTRGDINLNGAANEIADAVVFTNYFIYGLEAFTINQEGQIAATDVNADGMVLSVADLTYLIRVIIGDALPYAKIAPVTAKYDIKDGILSVDQEMGAAYVVIKGNVNPVNLTDNMEMKYAYDSENDVTRALLYSMEKDHKFTGSFLELNGTLIEIEMATYEGATVKLITDLLPTEFVLHQNKPNPFNPFTEFSFSLPVASDVTLVIYNVTGQKVATVAEDHFEAGTHTVRWDGSDYASGIYMYRITAGEFTDSKKMLLLK